MKAVILAAGEGTRLHPLTLETPKVLLPVQGIPLIQYTLSWLKSHGIKEVAINLYHFGNKIKDFLGNGCRFGMRIHYSPEKTLLGTAGGVKRIGHLFSRTFVVVYGDILTNFDLSAMIRFHRDKKAVATIVVTQVSNPREVGVVQMEDDGRIVTFVEKPSPGTEVGNMASGGIYVLEREVLDHIPSHGFCDFAYDIFPKLLKLNHSVYGYSLKPEDYLLDIGTIDKYHKANEDVREGLTLSINLSL